MTVYFAHAISDYDTDRERAAESALRAQFGVVVNPNQQAHRNGYAVYMESVHSYDPMGFWTNLVRHCDVLAYMPTKDFHIGPGVAREVLEAIVWGKPVFQIDLSGSGTPHLLRLNAQTLPPMRVLTIEEMRERIKTAKEARVVERENDNAGF